MHAGRHGKAGRVIVRGLRQLAAASAALSCLLFASPSHSGDFSINWGTAPFTWTAGAVGPTTFTATDQYGFQIQARFGITRIGGAAVAGYPDDLTGFGTNRSIWLVWDAAAGSSLIGSSTNTATMEILSGGSPFAVSGLNFQITDIDAVDNNAASGDRCDYVTATGNNGNPTLTYVSGVVASRSVRIGPGAGSGSSPALAANQAQCIFNVGAPTSPISNADDFGSILATSVPANTHTATVAYDESIGNVYGVPGYDAAARGTGVWGATFFSVPNTISLAKASTTTLVTAVGQVIPYTYTITNNGPLPINTGQNVYIQDSKIGTFSCGVIGTAIPSGGTYVCSQNYTTVAADLTTGANLDNTAIAGVGTGTQAFATRLQSNTAAYSIPRAPRLQITKVSTGGVGGFTFNGDNGWGSQVVTTTVSGTGVTGTVKYFTTSGLAAYVQETIPAGYELASATCSGLGAGGNYSVNTANGRVDFDAAAMAAGSNIACTFNNSRIDAVNDNFSAVPINGAGGGATATVFSNDTIAGAAFAPAAVTPTLTANGGLTGAILNADGTITVPPGTTSGTYVLTYQICSVITPASCDTATATIVVAATPPTGGTSCTGTNLANNGGVELPFFGAGTNNMVSPTGVPGWSTNDTAIEIWGNGFNGVPSHTGVQFMEMNANIGTSVLIQTPSAIHNRAQIDTFWAHRGRQGNDTARMTIADNGGGSTTSPNFTTGNTAWSTQSLVHLATATASSLTLTFDSISSTGGASLGNFIDTVEVCQTYITIAKSEASRTDADGSTTDSAGDTVTYAYAIANPAGNNRSLASVSVTDDKLGTINVTAPLSGDTNTNGFLDPGETWIVQADYTVTLADIESGSVTNIAYSSGSTGSNTIRSDDDTVTATFTAAPELTITKEADATALLGNVTAGQTITYTYVVTNTGNVTVSNVDVSDVHNGSDPDPAPLGETLTDVAPLLDSNDSIANDGVWSDLKPGDSVTFTATYQVTQTDVDMLQ